MACWDKLQSILGTDKLAHWKQRVTIPKLNFIGVQIKQNLRKEKTKTSKKGKILFMTHFKTVLNISRQHPNSLG